MIHSLLLFLGFRRPPLPPISRRASSDSLATMNALLSEDRRQFPTRYH